MSEPDGTGRRVGWLLLVGSPGLAAGVALTIGFFLASSNVRVPFPLGELLSLGFWALATVASAVGGSLVPGTSASSECRFGAGIVGAAFGAGVFFAAVVAADALFRRA